jgi:hypothetical protein
VEGIKGFGNDTNGQEGTGRWIKKTYRGGKPNLCQCLVYLADYGKDVHDQLVDEKLGNKTSYGKKSNPIDRAEERKKNSSKRRKKDSSNNDECRPPDTSRQLIKTRTAGGKKTRRVPNSGSIVDLSFGIPWSIPSKDNDGLGVTNTCPLDSFLMLLYHLRQFGIIPHAIFQRDPELNDVLNLIELKKYHEARMLWIFHTIDKTGVGTLRVTDFDDWDMWSDSEKFSRVCRLFQMTVRNIYGPCHIRGVINNGCLLNRHYEDRPENLVSQVDRVTYLEAEPSRYDGSIRTYFHSEHNTMGARRRDGGVKYGSLCGCDIVVNGRKVGCPSGKRAYRTQVMEAPEILEVFWVGNDLDVMTNLSRIEHSIEVHEQQYKFVGCLLYNGSHYRSICFVYGKYLEYDGNRYGRKLRWYGENDELDINWRVAKLWYAPVRDGETVSIPSELPEDVGVPDGLSISVFHNIMRNPNCSQCGVNFGYRDYCVVIKDPVTDGQHKEALYYHMGHTV